ncbi:EVE domain-containing protein [Chroococcidiopsis sp.]|uniref:EVE domain-containing protein n=1 Tax=Chroococcidiopsis sp. TaxID=3088168 RepID=UPI003F2AB84E
MTNYWLFQGNPKYYRILDAIRELETIPWRVTRYSKDIAVGDGVLVWMAGEKAGIYAIAEVAEPVQALTELPDKDYWLDPSKAGSKLHVKVRCLRRLLGQPLRRSELLYDRVLSNLPVIRAPGINYKITLEEWQRVHQLKG